MDAWRDVEVAALKEELRERARAIAAREAELDAWERELEEREERLAKRRRPRLQQKAKAPSLVEQLQVRLRGAATKGRRTG